MKKVVFLFLAALVVFSSCSFETYYACHSYGETNKATKYGSKAQTRYTKKNY